MNKQDLHGLIVTSATIGLLMWTMPASAQWLNYPTKGTPRTADGKPNLAAPTPRRPDGKPELTGVWMGVTKYMINIAADLKPEEIPFQPWAAAEYKRRRETESKDDPSAQCLPLSIVQISSVPMMTLRTPPRPPDSPMPPSTTTRITS